MRDIALYVVVWAGALCALKRPWIGVILWTWLSVMNPHSLTWASGGASHAMVAALATMTGLFLTKDRWSPFQSPAAMALLAFWLWTCVTLPFSFYFDDSMPLFIRSAKIYLMTFVCLALINTKHKLDWFVGILVFSLAFYGAKGGLFTILNGGNYLVWGPGGFIEGNNELALALVMTIPLIRYLQTQATQKWVRAGLWATLGLTAVTVLGTWSRGAFLAIAAMSFMMWMKGDRKMLWGFALFFIGIVALSMMPDAWWARMGTIQNYEQDASAMGRLNAWEMAWNLAKSNFFGGGFSIYEYPVFARYAPVAWDVHAAHSIYFQVLGEHGFVGLFLFLLIWFFTWKHAKTVTRLAAGVPELQWAMHLSRMLQVSLVGYFTGGAFLSLAYFDLPYDLMVASVVAMLLVKQHVAAHVQPIAQPRLWPAPPEPGRPAGPTGAPGQRQPAL
ncbi:putative O-glycosylation ligase, exosortase A system-associated [Piscinibacter koreensis]|uniref:Putative O-glycosylation ligase, exosortase A system-associated n=1 Tax=Piscinibacter koreensis TaxID=2742824 RepID=A0A7Y6TVI3_9BURK|nr:putative O-glycosylation ligase, exosortase A system-associated [Schlegelella koreensis]NUZ05149.1 putative O-glycosylation ligase, exosortase A system-associated [Schlegelella koreensis]